MPSFYIKKVNFKKSIRHDKTKLHLTATVTSLWFKVCWHVILNFNVVWSLHNQHNWNFSGVHSFLSFTVRISVKIAHFCSTYPMTVPGGDWTSISWRQQGQQQHWHRRGRDKCMTSLCMLSKIFISNGRPGPQHCRAQQSVSEDT